MKSQAASRAPCVLSHWPAPNDSALPGWSMMRLQILPRHLAIKRDQRPRIPALRMDTFLPVFFPSFIVDMLKHCGDDLAGHLPYIRMQLLPALNNIAAEYYLH